MFDTEQTIRLSSLSRPAANENMNKAAQYRTQVTTIPKVPGEGPPKISYLISTIFSLLRSEKINLGQDFTN